jgi:deoxynucleoside triphosphate triphosphohydrolase SAMHD1
MSTPRVKWIHDSIHGQIQLDDYCLKVMDTVQFQRLRDLKQLGAAYFVYPGGSHNRFEHSLGVCHLAGTLMEKLKVSQPELEITHDDVMCVKLAGLCHDLGHGPFSHVFDTEFIPRARPGRPWTHEQGSEMMLEYLIEDNHIDLDRQQIQLIKDLINGIPKSSSYEVASERGFLFDVVANKRNSVDVDKFDYLSRDCHNLGFKSGYDFSRLMNFNRVIDGRICFHSKEVYNVYEMFHTRFTLFKRVYKHRVGKFRMILYGFYFDHFNAGPHLCIREA